MKEVEVVEVAFLNTDRLELKIHQVLHSVVHLKKKKVKR